MRADKAPHAPDLSGVGGKGSQVCLLGSNQIENGAGG